MIAGVPNEARWTRSEPRRTLPSPLLARIIRSAFPRGNVVEVSPFADGLRNANFKVQLDRAPGLIVVRIYEHDISLCQKEIDLLRLIGRSVPVPEVIHAEPLGLEDTPAFTILRYVEGITFRELTRRGEAAAIAQAAYSAGKILASIGCISFAKAGWLAPGPRVAEPLLQGANPVPRFVDSCLTAANLQQRMRPDLRDRTHRLMWAWASRLAHLNDEASLVHGDYGKRNLLVRSIAGEWSVAAVLDWEFAVVGSSLADVGHFLRYERATRPVVEPHFSTGYLHGGGKLPEDWRQLARLLDLSALCESLTHDELPDSVSTELVELVSSGAENRDPRLA